LSAVTAQQAWEAYTRAERLFGPEAIEAALDRMAGEIRARLGRSVPVVVCLLNGGVVPYGRLLPRLDFPLETDYVHATRYGQKLRGGELAWLAGPFVPARGRTVLLVDDILDEGTTLRAIGARYRADGAREVFTAVLVEKDRPRAVPVKADFTGLTVPDRYVFGCGMDYKGWLRNAAGIYALSAADEGPAPAGGRA
jgi:hypoxanthine phosphoribosyltransferase